MTEAVATRIEAVTNELESVRFATGASGSLARLPRSKLSASRRVDFEGTDANNQRRHAEQYGGAQHEHGPPSKSCSRPSAILRPQCSTVTPIAPMRKLFIRIAMGTLATNNTRRFHSGARKKYDRMNASVIRGNR